MFDFIKISSKIGNPERYVRESGLPFIEGARTDTGDIVNKWEAQVDGVLIIVYKSGIILLKGSVHKYWNRGEHNYDDYYFNNFLTSISDLAQLLHLDLWEFKLDTLEVGVNIESPIDVDTFLSHCFMHKNVPFHRFSVNQP